MFNPGIFLFYSLLSLPVAPKEQAIVSAPLNTSEYPTFAVVPVADSINAASLINFARTLKGIPYRYGCADPQKGFDCSGFVMYVFNHFQMNVPRSSSGFTNFGKEIDLQQSIPGDIILFTGTNSTIRKVGHVGIVTQVREDALVFIHASSGKIPAVVETAMNPHYKERFLKVIRVLP
jgi:cell wall-associated NlpC family hydrolase